MQKVLAILVVIVVAAIAVIGGRWFLYVTRADDPLDEVGIELNSRMPDALRLWGCAQLKSRFSDRLPPYGCAAADGTGWE